MDSFWGGKFVAQRIIPPDRQNLGSILKENGLKAYDEPRREREKDLRRKQALWKRAWKG